MSSPTNSYALVLGSVGHGWPGRVFWRDAADVCSVIRHYKNTCYCQLQAFDEDPSTVRTVREGDLHVTLLFVSIS